MECSISNTENEPSMKKITLKKSIAMRKLQLLSKCVESMTQPSPDEKSLIEIKLSRLSKRHRMVVKKKGSWISSLKLKCQLSMKMNGKFWSFLVVPQLSC